MAQVSRDAATVPGVVPLRWVEEFCRIPYVAGGRDARGCDCWGLVVLVFRHQAGMDLDAFTAIESTDGATVQMVITREAAKWHPVSPGNETGFDVVVMRSIFEHNGRAGAADMHVGVVTAPGWLLHTQAKVGAMHVPLDHPSVKQRIRAIYRHRLLA